MSEPNVEGKTHFGNLNTYYIFLYCSAAIFLIALILIFSDSPDMGFLLLLVGAIIMIISFILFYIILYRIWKFIISKANAIGITTSIPTAGKAVGYLFIPLFGYYWLFKGIGKLPEEINKVSSQYKIQKLVPVNLGYIIASFSIIGIIPYIGYLIGAINLLVLLPLFLKSCVEACELIDGSEITSDKTIEELKADYVDLEAPKDYTFVDKSETIPDKIPVKLTMDMLDWESVKEYSSLFNKELFGINYYIGIALFASLILIRVLKISLISGYESSYLPAFDYYSLGIAIDLLVSIAFIAVCHFVTKSWWQPFVWGAVIVIIFFLRTQMIMDLQYPDSNEFLIRIPMPKIDQVFRDFIWGFAFMFGLVFAVNVWGAKIWSLIIGLASSYIIYKTLLFAIKYGTSPTEYDINYFLSEYDLLNISGRIITALLIYVALFLHFDNLQSNIKKGEGQREL